MAGETRDNGYTPVHHPPRADYGGCVSIAVPGPGVIYMDKVTNTSVETVHGPPIGRTVR